MAEAFAHGHFGRQESEFPLPELDRMCAYLNVPNNIKEECAVLYRKCVNKGIVREKSH